MSKKWIINAGVILSLMLTMNVYADNKTYKWIKDKEVSSKDVLKASQTKRVINLSEEKTLQLIREVMTKDIHLALAEYHKTKHRQDAETVSDSVLPEKIIGEEELELFDENYRFILQVRLKKVGKRTRIIAEAYPMYRVEEESDTKEDNTLEVKVKANKNQVVAMGPIFIAPISGIPSEYNVEILPEAANIAAKVVKSFMYFVDEKVKNKK